MPTDSERHGVRPELHALLVRTSSLRPYPGNARTHDDEALQESLRQHGQYKPITVRQETGEVLAGNGTYAAALALGWTHLAVTPVSCTDEQARRIVLVDNRSHDLGGYDDALLAQLLRELDSTPAGHAGTGYDEAAVATLYAQLEAADPQPTSPKLADRFLVPPFSVLDARQGWWRDRKREWLGIGIQSELGRANDLLRSGRAPGTSATDVQRGGGKYHDPTGEVRTRVGAYGAQAKQAADGTLTYTVTTGATSVFDPVLCELVYRWFCPPGGRVLDPYAGGSVRGIVAAKLGLQYVGLELRAAQVEANRAQAVSLLSEPDEGHASWQHGDAGQLLPALDGAGFDLAFTCPPYYDLEAYSADPADLSSMDTPAFLQAYQQHLAGVYGALAPDAYAVLVVGSARDKQGHVRDLRAATVQAAEAVGFHLHQDAVLVTPVGSLPVRSAKQFEATRVLGRTHQDVLVLLKGDRKRAAQRLGSVDVTDALSTVTQDADPDPASSIPTPVVGPGSASTPERSGYQPPADSAPATVQLRDDKTGRTHVELYGEVYVKRDDTFEAHGQYGGKVRACLSILQAALEQGATGCVTAGSRHSPQVEIVSGLAQALGLECRAHVPAGDDTPALRNARAAGAEVVPHRPGHNSVIVARARQDALERGWVEVPFGMECQEAVQATAAQVTPGGTWQRIVVPVGSGMSAAGILHGLAAWDLDTPVLGVVVGADPTRRLDRWAPPGWRDQLTLQRSPLPYDKRPTLTRLGQLELDPVYEAKCLPYLQPGDLLWCVGIRQHP